MMKMMREVDIARVVKIFVKTVKIAEIVKMTKIRYHRPQTHR